MKKKKIHLNKLLIIRSIFVLIFIVSLFSTINAFANTNPFKIIDAVISDKSEGVTGDKVKDNIKFYKLDDNVTESSNIFGVLRSIVGGANTAYTSCVGIDYAHVDGGESNPGHFTQP